MLTFKIYYKNFTEIKTSFLKIFKNKVTSNSILYLFNENKYLSNDIIYFILGLLFHELFKPIHHTDSCWLSKIYYKNFTEIKKSFLKIFKNKVTSNSIRYYFNENKCLSNNIIHFILCLLFNELFKSIHHTDSW